MGQRTDERQGEGENGRREGLRHLPGVMVLKLKPASESPARLVEIQIAGPQPRDSDLVGLEGRIGWGPENLHSNNANSAGSGPYFENH